MSNKKELKVIYIEDVETLFHRSGELHLVNKKHHIVFNCDTFFNDLPYIVESVITDRKSQTNFVKDKLNKLISKL